MTFYSAASVFNKGEISPRLHSRFDIATWQSSLKECTNFQVLVHGAIRRRSGTIFVTEIANSSKRSRLLPFVFNSEQAYVLDVNGGGTIRFAADRAYLLSSGSPYAISHQWAEADLFHLSWAQANDVMYVAHKNYTPCKIERKGDTDWSIADCVFKDGPYLDLTTVTTTLTPSERGSITPVMTGATAPSGTASASANSANAYRAFDADPGTYWDTSGGTSGTLSYLFDSSISKVADAYSLQARGQAEAATFTPTNFRFEGYDGTNWVTLDSRPAETSWTAGEKRFYEFANETAYQGYRISWTATADGEAIHSALAEFSIHERAEDQIPFDLTASSATDINGGQGFLASDVGRHIRLKASDGRWRWAKIIARTSSTIVTIRLYGHALPDTTPISSWQMGSFSDASGWPGAVTLYDERLTFARTDAQPLSVFGSKQSQFDDFGTSEPVKETDGLSLTLLSSRMNEILWVSDDGDLVAGTPGQIRSIGPADFTKSFSATNLTQKKGPTNGAFFIQPITIGGVTLYVGAGGTSIRELVIGDQSRYVAPELTILCDHLLKSGIVDWTFAESPTPTIFAVTGEGHLVAIAYDRDQETVGASRYVIAGGAVESVAAVPGVTAGVTDVYLVVRRTINGQVKRYIEVLDDPFDPDTMDVEDAFFVDCGLKYSGSPIQTIIGLDHLEGEEVIALADGGVVRDGLVVTAGSITLPYPASNIAVGLPYTSKAVTLPISGPQQDGSLFGRRVNVIAPAVDVLGSGSLRVGALGSEDWMPPIEEQLFHAGDDIFGNRVELKTGFQHCQIESSWADGGGSIVMETDEPLPLLVRSLVMQLDTEP